MREGGGAVLASFFCRDRDENVTPAAVEGVSVRATDVSRW
jgi:hypothetical protein